MNRRNFILSGLAGIAAPIALKASKRSFDEKVKNDKIEEKGLIKPRKLSAGDKVAIIAPATAVSDPWQLQQAKNNLERFGLEVIFGKKVAAGSGYKTRTVEERIEDLHSAFSDKEIKAVIAIRGGYGSMQLLENIDYALIRNNPKIFIGYSDITAMHLAISKFSRIVTFHGPIANNYYNPYTYDYFFKALFKSEPIGNADNGKEAPPNSIKKISDGSAEGELIGGNLSLIASTMGTPFEINTENKILFIEDVGEEPYRIDRMLTQLELAGKLDSAAGFVIGECKDCASADYKPSMIWDGSLGEILDKKIGKLKKPAIYGLTFGHTQNQVTLPIGIKAKLDANNKQFAIIESACI